MPSVSKTLHGAAERSIIAGQLQMGCKDYKITLVSGATDISNHFGAIFYNFIPRKICACIYIGCMVSGLHRDHMID